MKRENSVSIYVDVLNETHTFQLNCLYLNDYIIFIKNISIARL